MRVELPPIAAGVHRLAFVAWAVLAPACDDAASAAGGPRVLRAGGLTFTLRLVVDPPTVGRNVLNVTPADADGAALDGAVVTVEPWMAAHGHGPPDPAVVTPQGQGLYRAAPVDFFMPGRWVVYVDAAAGGTEVSVESTWDIR